MKKNKQRRGGVLFIVLGVMAAISVIILGLIHQIQEKMEDSATASIQGTVQMIADSTSMLYTTKVNGVYQLGSALQMDAETEPLLQEAQKNGIFSWAAVANAATGEGICCDGSAFSVKNLHCADTALKGEKSVSDAYINSQGTWAFTVQCPIYEKDRLTGALYADISVEQFSEVLPTSLYNGSGVLYLLDRGTKRFMLQPMSSGLHISTKYDLAGFLNEFSDVEGEVEQGIYEAVNKGQKQIVQIQFNGAPSYLFFWPVEESSWCLCGIVPESGIQQESSAVGYTISLVAVITFIAAAFILWILYWNDRRNTKRRREEEQKRIVLFSGIAASINEAVLMYDCATGKRELAFDNLNRVLGVDIDEFEMLSGTEDFRSRFEGTAFEKVICQRAFGSQQNSSEKLEWTNPKTGKQQWLRSDIFYIDLQGKKKCIVSIDDFTKEESLQDSLRTAALAAQNANQVKSQFLSNMSHEIRTPLNAVSGMLQIARKRLVDGGDVVDCLNKAEDASSQLLSLINEVLDLSKIESGKLLLAEEWFRLDEEVKKISGTMDIWFHRKKQRFELDIRDCEGLELYGDAVRLSQILLNLLSNASKYTPEDGRIALRIRHKPSHVKGSEQFTFIVEDSGYGMSEEFQRRMFLPFEQEHDAAAKRESGTGLGLSIVNNLVSLMGGFLKLDSEKGRGTTFEIHLTFRCNAVAYLAEGPDFGKVGAADFAGRRVLLAEDNELNREIAKEFLEMAHGEVACAENGKEALERFRASPEGYFDFILMDMQMPVMDGIEATRQIRALPRKDARTVLIIAATANAFLEDEKKCLEAGMDDYISKPMNMEKLYQTILKHRRKK